MNCYRFLFITLLLIFNFFKIKNSYAEDNIKQQDSTLNIVTPVLKFPKELPDNIYNLGIKNRDYYQYSHIIKNETGAVKESELVWKEDNLTTDLKIKSLKIDFLTKDKRFTDSNFSVEIRYPRHDHIEIQHSKPALAKHSNGVIVRFNKSLESSWGGVIYGNKTAGILYFVSRTAHNQNRTPALILCPRFVKPQGRTFIVDGTDSLLKKITGSASGSATAQFRAGYDDGDVALSFETIGMASNGSGTAELRSKMPLVNLVYQPEGLAESVEVKDDQASYIAISAVAKFRNAAGYLKTESQSTTLWAVNKDLTIDEDINVTQYPTDPKSIKPKRGQCVLVFETKNIDRDYQTP